MSIHQQLIDLDLLGYVEWLREHNKTRLFEELKADKHGKFNRKFSRWFNQTYMNTNNCNIEKPADKRKDFHSIRHTMIDYFKQYDRSYDPNTISELVGHEITGEHLLHMPKRPI